MDNRKYTLRDVLDAYAPKRALDRQNVNAVITRWPSFLVTPLFLCLGISPNRITLMSFVMGVVSVACLAVPDQRFQVFAYFGLYIASYLDYVDGNVARTLKVTNYFGKFLDGALGVAYKSFFFLAIGCSLGFDSVTIITEIPRPFLTVLGGLASLAFMLKCYFPVRLRGELFELRLARVSLVGSRVLDGETGVRKWTRQTVKVITRGIRELEWPLLIVGILFGLDVYLVVFGVFSVGEAAFKSLDVFRDASRQLRHPRKY